MSIMSCASVVIGLLHAHFMLRFADLVQGDHACIEWQPYRAAFEASEILQLVAASAPPDQCHKLSLDGSQIVSCIADGAGPPMLMQYQNHLRECMKTASL